MCDVYNVYPLNRRAHSNCNFKISYCATEQKVELCGRNKCQPSDVSIPFFLTLQKQNNCTHSFFELNYGQKIEKRLKQDPFLARRNSHRSKNELHKKRGFVRNQHFRLLVLYRLKSTGPDMNWNKRTSLNKNGLLIQFWVYKTCEPH